MLNNQFQLTVFQKVLLGVFHQFGAVSETAYSRVAPNAQKLSHVVSDVTMIDSQRSPTWIGLAANSAHIVLCFAQSLVVRQSQSVFLHELAFACAQIRTIEVRVLRWFVMFQSSFPSRCFALRENGYLALVLPSSCATIHSLQVGKRPLSDARFAIGTLSAPSLPTVFYKIFDALNFIAGRTSLSMYWALNPLGLRRRSRMAHPLVTVKAANKRAEACGSSNKSRFGFCQKAVSANALWYFIVGHVVHSPKQLVNCVAGSVDRLRGLSSRLILTQ